MEGGGGGGGAAERMTTPSAQITNTKVRCNTCSNWWADPSNVPQCRIRRRRRMGETGGEQEKRGGGIHPTYAERKDLKCLVARLLPCVCAKVQRELAHVPSGACVRVPRNQLWTRSLPIREPNQHVAKRKMIWDACFSSWVDFQLQSPSTSFL
jgi:hypothetical protein